MVTTESETQNPEPAAAPQVQDPVVLREIASKANKEAAGYRIQLKESLSKFDELTKNFSTVQDKLSLYDAEKEKQERDALLKKGNIEELMNKHAQEIQTKEKLINELAQKTDKLDFYKAFYNDVKSRELEKIPDEATRAKFKDLNLDIILEYTKLINSTEPLKNGPGANVSIVDNILDPSKITFEDLNNIAIKSKNASQTEQYMQKLGILNK